MIYDCVIIGGGIAGLQAAIQLGRYNYQVLVVDSNNGRSTLCKCYHNLLGWPKGVSGDTLRKLGREQAEELNVHFQQEKVKEIIKMDDIFQVKSTNNNEYQTKTLLLATGVKDNLPPFPKLQPCLGKSVFVCPDCDGYATSDKPTIVLGKGKAGVTMALALTHWTTRITYINLQESLEVALQNELLQKDIKLISSEVSEAVVKNDAFQGVILASGQVIEAPTAFLAMGGNKVNSDLAMQLGVELEKNKHIKVDPRTKETSVKNVWAAGDVVAHSEQVAIAMGDGVQAAIWIHKSLKKKSKGH